MIDTKAKKNQLLNELVEVAMKKNMPKRAEKLEEIHKRINAIERYEKEYNPLAAAAPSDEE